MIQLNIDNEPIPEDKTDEFGLSCPPMDFNSSEKWNFRNWPELFDHILGDVREDFNLRTPRHASFSKSQQFNLQELISLVTQTGCPISKSFKKRIMNVRNRNLHNFLTKTRNRNVILSSLDIVNEIKQKKIKQKKIKDPSKSTSMFFVELALLRQYSTHVQLYDALSHTETIKKKENKKTRPCTPEELAIITKQIKFFKQIAQLFYSDPQKAILMAYLRNHSIEKLKKGQLDKWTIDGITKTCELLNGYRLHYHVHIQLPVFGISRRSRKTAKKSSKKMKAAEQTM